MFSGTVRTRDRLPVRPGDTDGKVTAISVFDRGAAVQRDVGRRRADRQALGPRRRPDRRRDRRRHRGRRTRTTSPRRRWRRSSSPCRRGDKGALHVALAQLAEQDPLINLRQDDVRQEISVSLYGEVQKEVIQATLADDFGIDVTFRETTTICIERPVGTGAAVEIIGEEPNPFLATVGLRVEPAPVGSGVEFRLEVELGSMPLSFLKAVEETVRETLQQGLYGWQVTDCIGHHDALGLLRRGRATRTARSTRACRAPPATSAT